MFLCHFTLTKDHRLHTSVLYFFSFEASEVYYFHQSAPKGLSLQVEETLYSSYVLLHTTLPPHPMMQLLLRKISCWSAEDFFPRLSKIQVLWTSVKVLFYSHSINLMHLKIPTHLGLWIYVSRKAQSFCLLHIKTTNTFYEHKFNKIGRLGTWNCSAPYVAQGVLRLRLNIAGHALLTCLWLPWRDKVKG